MEDSVLFYFYLDNSVYRICVKVNWVTLYIITKIETHIHTADTGGLES